MPLKFHLPVLEFNVLLVQIKLEINIWELVTKTLNLIFKNLE